MSVTHESETRTPGVPSLSLLIRQGRADAEKHGQRTRDALAYWFRQTERLNIARSHYRLRGDRFADFARRIGVDRSSAFELVKLHKHKAAVLSRCLDEAEQAAVRGEVYHYPGWQTALAWFEGKPEPDQAQYWLVPPEVYGPLNVEFGFDFDPCPCPRPTGWDALKMPWGRSNFVNAPFSSEDGPGLTAFVRKAIDEQRLGNTSVMLVPMPLSLQMLVTAGADIRPLGRVRFLDVQTKVPWPHPMPCFAFILRGATT